MTIQRSWWGLFCLTVLATGTAQAQQKVQRSVRRTPNGVQLDFQQADLKLVISALAQLAGLNVLFSDIPSRPVTLRTSRPASKEELVGFLENVAKANGLTLTHEGGLVRIAAAKAEGPSTKSHPAPLPANQAKKIYVYELRHAQASQIAATLTAIFGGSPVSGSAGRRTPQSLSEQLQQQQLAPTSPDKPAGQAPDGNGAAAPSPGDMQGITGRLHAETQIVPDPATNSLLIRATPEDYKVVTAAIRKLDARPAEVLIEVLIAEVRHNRDLGLGVTATAKIPDDVKRGVHVGGELSGLSAGDLAVRLLSLDHLRVESILRILSSSSKVTVLSRPVLLAQNNEQARILVGSQRPFIQVFRALPTDAAIRDQVVQFRDVGTQLTITPTINPDNYVTMNVLQEVSNATAEVQFGAPVISTREAQTRLLVKDGHTAVIGGLIEHQKETSKSGIPILKDIPILGGLFGSTTTRNASTELLVFLTPHVLRTDSAMDRTTDDLRGQAGDLDNHLPADLQLLPARPDSTVVPDSAAPAENRDPLGFLKGAGS